ncbi:MAG: DivIVA domain-containing protein [Microthrixaceae bacterium]
MDVTPQLLHDVEFREAKRGGYNTQDVDEFLERLAVGLERQDAALKEARQRLEAAETRAADAERRASQFSEASASEETIKRTLVLAQRTADAAIREAEEEAARTLSSARAESERLLSEAQQSSARAHAEAEAEARAAHEEAQAKVLGEMHDLEAFRDRLHEDVEVLERHLEEQRERVRRTVEELHRILDDPESLYPTEPPVVSDLVTPHDDDASVDDDPVDWAPDEDLWEESAIVDLDDGPATEAVDVLADSEEDDDAYLSELRKAMTDDTPLGPRDDALDAELFEPAPEPERSRFGRRR